jgi:hypothetical protein
MPFRVGACHQKPHDCACAQHGVVERPMLVVLRGIQTHEFRPQRDHRPHGREVAGAHRVDQSADGDAVDVRLEFRPARKPVRSGEYELGVVQGEGLAVRSTEVRVDFRDGGGIGGGERLSSSLPAV